MHPKYNALRLTPPHNRATLALWVRLFCNLHMPTRPLCPHHNTPLDYLAHTFFEPTAAAARNDQCSTTNDQLPITNPQLPADPHFTTQPFNHLTNASRDSVTWAPRGGGKTQLGAVATLLDMLFKPGIQIRILGGSMEQSTKMFAYLRTLVSKHFVDFLAAEPTQKSLRFINGSRAECLAQSHRAVRGCRVQKLRADEVDVFDPDVWSAAQLVTRSTPTIAAGVEALSTAHRPFGLMRSTIDAAAQKNIPIFTWCIWDVIEQCPPARDCTTCPLLDGCGGRAKHATGFMKIDDLIAMRKRVSETVWNHEMLCLPATFEDAVFPSFSPAKHVRAFSLKSHTLLEDPTYPTAQPITRIAGIDFGFTGPFVCLTLVITQTPQDPTTLPHIYVLDEYLAHRKRLDENIAAMTARFQSQMTNAAECSIFNGQLSMTLRNTTVESPQRSDPKTIDHWPLKIDHSPLPLLYVDTAGSHPNTHTGQSDITLLRAAGYTVKHKFQPILPGINLIDSLLNPATGSPRITIHPCCTHLITALQSYRWQPGHSAPEKDGTHDHPLDALRYALIGHLGAGTGTQFRLY